MHSSFFNHPLWRKFQNRPIFVICVSDSEHRLRDAKAIIRLRDFLPPSDSGICTYSVSTIHDRRSAPWPGSAIPANAAVIVLGRPALFGPEARTFVQQFSPALGYHFDSDDVDSLTSYRTIVADDAETKPFACPSFEDQRKTQPSPKCLFDYGLVYSGWHGPSDEKTRPVMLLAGTSTLGTWAAVKFVTEALHGPDIRWHDDIQGLVIAEAANTPEAFDDVHAQVLSDEMLTPSRIWMEGGDLPPCSQQAWIQAYELSSKKPSGQRAHDLRILINEKEILPKHRTYIPPLVLLALANSKRLSRFPGGFSSSATATEVCDAVRAYLRLSSRDWYELGLAAQVYGMLKPMIRQIRRAGGIASIRHRGSDDGATSAYAFSFRPLPFFLQLP